MRKIMVILLFGWLSFGLSASSIHADGAVLPNALSPDYLAVRYHHVTVEIKDGHAVTRVDQEFFNPHPVAVEGWYTFPIPPDAILSNFRVTLDGQPQTVTRQNQAQTNAALHDVITQRRDPSLLRYADWETLVFDLGLPAGGSRQMSLEYEEVLVPAGGLYRYRYILSTERYTAQPLAEASIAINLNSSAGLGTLYSSSHAVTTERLATGQARVSWQAENVQPTEDFDLFFAPAEDGFGRGLLTGRREGRNHFLFLFAPDTESIQDETLAKDIVFVIDRSGSMGGEKIEQARNALHFILNRLNPSDRFSIVGFDDHVTVLSDTLQRSDQQSLATARRFVDTLRAGGSTNLEAALQTALAIMTQSESRSNVSKMIVFLTDGLPTAGITDTGLIADLVGRANQEMAARMHVFGVGYDVNSHLLDRLAAENGGSVTYVQPGENLEMVLSDFFGRIANPVLTDLKVSFEGMTVSNLHPQLLPELFQGTSLLLTGQYQAAGPDVTVRVRGQAGEAQREYSYHFKLDQAGGHDFVPRLWATRRVGQLLDQIRVEGENPALVEKIRGLGLDYGLVTPYTTFVIQAQSSGAASVKNMSLYGNLLDLGRQSGQTTIQARVQNQMYQQADQANLAIGANIINTGQQSLAQISNQNIDLSLLQAQQTLDGPITPRWIEDNIKVDRQVTFGSSAYFALAGDPVARAYLQSGPNVVFAHNGEVIAVIDPEDPPQEKQAYEPPQNFQPGVISNLYNFIQQFFGSRER